MVKFIIEFEKTIELGIILKKARERLNLTTQEVNQKTNISTTDINYIENGKKNKINPFMLKKLCQLYKINLLEIYEMIGYIDKNDLIEYTNLDKINYEIVENNKIPVYALNSDVNNILTGIPSFYIQLPINNVFFKAIDLRNNIFEDKILALFNTNINKLKNGDIGLFLYNKEFYIAKYYSTNSNSILILLDKDISTLVFKNNDQPEILGKLFTFI